MARAGSVAEWSIAPVLKTGNGQPFVSSNLTASARPHRPFTDELASRAACGTMPRVSYLELLQTTLKAGLSLDAGLEFLRGSGASPAEAAVAVQLAIGLPADEARDAVARSRAWAG